MELIDYISAVRRRWYLPLALTAVAVLAVLLTMPESSPQVRSGEVRYTAVHTLVSDGSGGAAGANLERTAFLVTVGDIPVRVAERLGGGEPAELAGQVRVAAEPVLGTLQISVTDAEPRRAERLADAFAEETIRFFEEQAASSYEAALARASESVEREEARVRELDEQLRRTSESSADYDLVQAQRDSAVNAYRAAYEQFQAISIDGPPSAGLETLQDASALAQPVDTGFQPPESRTGRLAVGVVAAALLGLGLALLVDRLDTRLRSRSDFEAVYGAPVLAEVPLLRRARSSALLSAPGADVGSLEAHRALRTQLLLRMEHRNGSAGSAGQVVLVTSAMAKEGKTTTVANLATIFAEIGRSVLVLGADLQHRDIDGVLGVGAPGPGVAEILAGEATLDACIRDTANPSVRFLSGGGDGAPHRGLLDGIGALFAEAARGADVIVVDTAPLLLSSDAAELAVRADHVVVVGRVGRTSRVAATRAGELLSTLTTPAGVVLLGAPQAAGRYAAYYAEPGRVRVRGPEPEPEIGAEPARSNGHAVLEPAPRDDERFRRSAQYLLRRDGAEVRLEGQGGGPVHRLEPPEVVVWRELVLPRTRAELRNAVEGDHSSADATAALERLLRLGAVHPVS